jgi:hypothetical protein
MKPKPYRKTKELKPSKLTKFKANAGGGKVKMVPKGPESSIGTCATTPGVEQGNDKGGASINA